MCAELRSKREQCLVAVARCGQLHAAVRAWNRDCGHAGEAEGRGVAKQADAGLAVIGAGCEARDGGRGQQNELVRGEELVHARAEIGVTLAQRGDFVGLEARAPLQPITNSRLESIEVAGVDLRRLSGLQRRKDFDRIGPPAGLDGLRFESKSLQFANDAAEAGDDSGSQS